ncbi:protein ALP1-like [Beta vulgaris subsp. vulgaris]|uniref:protein ALP1-like n=1 Tax=Beta vulgaris subsp. vulgaris TaxID=3555 RepID=UPI002547C99C|nr:protein ALP1-like [Beta vulgaris subsp. vulgaris]
MSVKLGHFSFSNGKPLSLDDQVAVGLRRLSSGESLISVGESLGLHHSIVSQVTWRFVESMEKRGLHHLRWPSSDEEKTKIKTKFEKIRGFPNCCGAIDTTHITMCLPLADPANKVWFDHEKNHIMLLHAIVDPDMRLRDIVTGWPGKLSDSLVLKTSNFFKVCEKGNGLNGKPVFLSEEYSKSKLAKYCESKMDYHALIVETASYEFSVPSITRIPSYNQLQIK